MHYLAVDVASLLIGLMLLLILGGVEFDRILCLALYFGVEIGSKWLLNSLFRHLCGSIHFPLNWLLNDEIISNSLYRFYSS